MAILQFIKPDKVILLNSTDFKGQSELKENPAVAVKDVLMDLIGTITDNTISIVASLDNSFIGRQGIRTL